MAQYPAISVFAVDDTLISGKLWDHIVRQVLLEAPTRAPRYGAELALHGFSRHVLRKSEAPNSKAVTALRMISRLDSESRNFIVDYVVDRLVRDSLKPGAVDTLIQRRKAGDRIFFVSDCFDFCLARFAARLGGAEIIASRTFEDDDGTIVVGAGTDLSSGEAKLARLKEHFDGERRPPFVRAYAHAAQDFPMLAWADAGTAVNPTDQALKEAQATGLSVVDWTMGIHDAPLHRPALPGTPAVDEGQESGQRSSNRSN